MQTSRRQFLQATLGTAAALTVSSNLLASPPSSNDSILVLVHLAGGNDGLNTVIPFRSPEYHDARPQLALKDNLLPLTHDLALHPALASFKTLFDQGHLAIVNGVGYPNPSRSHFRSLEVWHSADPSQSFSTGWLARAIAASQSSPISALTLGSQLPQSFASDQLIPTTHTLGQLPLHILSSNPSFAPSLLRTLPQITPPDSRGLSSQLNLISQLITANAGPRLYTCQLTGFDTHANQLPQHQHSLQQLSDALSIFYNTLAAAGQADKVTLLCFSEFGRRVSQNNSHGTDHGTASPAFLIGSKIKGGLYGAYPSLSHLNAGDLQYTTDFRRLYATLLDKWLNLNPTPILQNHFQPLAFL